MKRLLLALTLLLPLPTRAADPPTLVPLTRWALVVGANDGGGDRTRLRFAGADAQAFADVMTGFGGIDRSRAVILREPSVSGVRAGIADLGRRLSAAPGTGPQEVAVGVGGGRATKARPIASARAPGVRTCFCSTTRATRTSRACCSPASACPTPSCAPPSRRCPRRCASPSSTVARPGP